MKSLLASTALMLAAIPAHAEAVKYTIDPGHAQVLFSFEHLGFSTVFGMFSGFSGDIAFDKEHPENSTVSVTMPVKSMITGFPARFDHFMSPDFFDATDDEMVSFVSTGIEVTGETTGVITGDLTINGVTKSIALDAEMTQMGDHPMANKPWVGFNATTTVVRSEFDMGQFAPYVSDEVEVFISIEAMRAE